MLLSRASMVPLLTPHLALPTLPPNCLIPTSHLKVSWSDGVFVARWRTHRGDSPLFHTQVAIQTRISATSALLHSVLPFATTPEPDQAALATELVAIFSAWGGCTALDTHGPLAASSTLAYPPR